MIIRDGQPTAKVARKPPFNLLQKAIKLSCYITRSHTPPAPRLFLQHLSEEVVHQIIGEAVEVEKAFICDALPVSLIGMNSDLMREYIEYCADR